MLASPATTPPPVDRRELLAVGALLALALVLRLVNFGWGIPLDPYTGTYHPDEHKIVQGALDFPGDIATRTDLRYPTGYHYAIALIAYPLRPLVLKLLPGADTLLATFVVGRALTLSLALLAIWLTWLLGRRWYGRWGGLIAAALLSVTMVHVVHSGFATLDVPTSCMVVAGLWACDRMVRQKGWGNVLLLALLSGLLIGTKYPGAVIVLPAFLAICVGYARNTPDAGPHDRLRLRLLFNYLVVYWAVTLIVALPTTPAMVLHPENFRAAIDYEQDRQGFGDANWLAPDAWLGAVDALQVAAGPALGLLFAISLLAALYRPGYSEALLLTLLVPYYLVLGDRVANRYLILLLPVYALLSGRLAALALGSPRAAVRWIGGGTVAVIWVATLWNSVAAVAAIHQPDLRSQAALFLVAQAPAGATVCLDQVGEDDAQTWKEPPLPQGRYPLVDCGAEPAWVITVGGLGRIERALATTYVQSDYRWDEAHRDWWPDGEPVPPERLRFYDRLLPGRDGRRDYELAANFARDKLPTIPFDVGVVSVWRRTRD